MIDDICNVCNVKERYGRVIPMWKAPSANNVNSFISALMKDSIIILFYFFFRGCLPSDPHISVRWFNYIISTNSS